TPLSATAASSSQINLVWTDNAGNEGGFRIERCQGTGCTNFLPVTTVSANVTSFANTNLAASTTYVYRVFAFNTGGDSAASNTAEGTTQTPPATPPAPSGLTATAASRSQINLSWIDNSGNETDFKIERCKGANCANFAQVGTVGSNATTFPDTGLAKNTTYRYRVRAYNVSGNSAYSNTASARTLNVSKSSTLFLTKTPQ
ncbi:MAG: fibronectin type III domain-containing protein, partial [Pyrinomonadaceae bacterium]